MPIPASPEAKGLIHPKPGKAASAAAALGLAEEEHAG